MGSDEPLCYSGKSTLQLRFRGTGPGTSHFGFPTGVSDVWGSFYFSAFLIPPGS